MGRKEKRSDVHASESGALQGGRKTLATRWTHPYQPGVETTSARALSPSHRRHLLWLCVPCFLLPFVFVNQVISWMVPIPEMDEVRAKYDRFAERKDDYHAIFLGSSRFYQQIDPEVFDQEAKAAEVEMCSFNFGVNGLKGYEIDYLLHRILELKPRRLKWVFLEPTRVDTKAENENFSSVRNVYWRDLPRTARLANFIWRDLEMSNSGKLRGSLEHVKLGLQQTANLGRGSEFFMRILPARLSQSFKGSIREVRRERRMRERDLGPRGDGFRPLPKPFPRELLEKRQSYLAMALAAHEEFRARPPAQAKPGRGNRWWPIMSVLIERVSAAGRRSIFVATPRLVHQTEMPLGLTWLIRHESRSSGMIDLSDPAEVPQLFAIENRRDLEHLNTRGAELFTRLLAQRFIEIAKEK